MFPRCCLWFLLLSVAVDNSMGSDAANDVCNTLHTRKFVEFKTEPWLGKWYQQMTTEKVSEKEKCVSFKLSPAKTNSHWETFKLETTTGKKTKSYLLSYLYGTLDFALSSYDQQDLVISLWRLRGTDPASWAIFFFCHGKTIDVVSESNFVVVTRDSKPAKSILEAAQKYANNLTSSDLLKPVGREDCPTGKSHLQKKSKH